MDLISLVLVGGGGHASDVLQAVEALNDRHPTYRVVGVLDDGDVDPRRFAGRGVTHIGTVADLAGIDAHYVLAAGWPAVRRQLAERIGSSGHPAAPIIHPGAEVGAGVVLGPGTVILDHVHLSPMVELGAHGLVSYGATVGHDCRFGSYASILPNAAVSGDVMGGDDVLVGTGASVIQGRQLGDRCQVGAGAAVIHDVGHDETVVGVPARPRPAR